MLSASSSFAQAIPGFKELFINHELLLCETSRPALASSVGGIRVGILGGGTAGWLTALALRAQLPAVDVTVIESRTLPIVGVGEASVPSMVPFLHHTLGLDVIEFTREVKPTWKQGIRFEWGLPGDYVFQAPFDWEVNGVGMLGSMAETGNVSAFTLQAILMARGVTPVIRVGGELQSFLPLLPFAYHLDNQRLVAYLRRTAVARGVRHVDRKIVDAPLASPAAPDDDPRIAHLVTEGGGQLAFDLYVDCSGFRSFLLEQKLGVKFLSYASSLYTDSAIAFNAPHGGVLKPYTTARTMENGWCWNIPMVESDHLGYVYSSGHCSDDQALAEARRLWPDMTGERVIRFRSGRHARAWVGNVFAIGNAYGFVEPLESTGLVMITRAIGALLRALPAGWGGGDPASGGCAVMKRFVDKAIGHGWDQLRWFLATHYKYNRRLDSRFWREVRDGADVSGIKDTLDLFRTCGPLSLLPRAIRIDLPATTDIPFYGLSGLDCILLGQKVPYPALPREPSSTWRARRRTALDFARRAMPQADALRAAWERPGWLEQLVAHPSSWVPSMAL
jgi:tryptophan halogenase